VVISQQRYITTTKTRAGRDREDRFAPRQWGTNKTLQINDKSM